MLAKPKFTGLQRGTKSIAILTLNEFTGDMSQ